jgi:hypothetical protein
MSTATPSLQAREGIVEHCAVKRFFIFEVVVAEPVDPRLAGNARARSGNAVLSKLVRRSLQNGARLSSGCPRDPGGANRDGDERVEPFDLH